MWSLVCKLYFYTTSIIYILRMLRVSANSILTTPVVSRWLHLMQYIKYFPHSLSLSLFLSLIASVHHSTRWQYLVAMATGRRRRSSISQSSQWIFIRSRKVCYNYTGTYLLFFRGKSITACCLSKLAGHFYIGTDSGNIYTLDVRLFMLKPDEVITFTNATAL